MTLLILIIDEIDSKASEDSLVSICTLHKMIDFRIVEISTYTSK